LLGTIDTDTGAIATSVASIDTKTPALGQALAASSVPVVLTAAQVSTLTPPAAITGFALETTATSIKTAVETIDNAISGNEMQVDVITMPTVTVTATNLDVQSGGADLATSTQAGAIQTAVELIDDTVKVLGTDTYTEAATKGLVIGAVRRDADTTLVNTTNEIGPVQMNAAGQLKVEVFSGEALPVTDNSSSLSVDWNGTQPVTGSGTATGALRVELPTNGTGTVGLNAGTNAIGKLAANSGVDIGDVDVTSVNGFAAHDAAIAGNPLIIGGVSSAAAPTSVSADQEAVRAWYLRNGAAATVLTAAGALIGGDASNGLDVDVTRVGGTVAVTQSGTWDEVGINDSGNSITVDNGGTFVVQENGAALTALQLLDDGVATVASAITTKGMAAVGTDGTNARILKTDTSGELQVDVLTMPTVTVNSHAVTNAGTFAVQVDGSALTALQKIDDPVIVDDAAFTPATSSVMMAGFQADETATDSVDEGDGGAARMTLDRKVIVTVQPHTAGGWSTANMTTGDTFTALTNSAQAIKASAGQLGGWYIYNPNATAAYVNLYDIASGSVTVGTSTPKMNLCIPPTAAANLELVNGIPFGTAISVSATTTGGGNTAPGTALEAMFWYK